MKKVRRRNRKSMSWMDLPLYVRLYWALQVGIMLLLLRYQLGF